MEYNYAFDKKKPLNKINGISNGPKIAVATSSFSERTAIK